MDNYRRREFIRLSALGFAGIALQFHTISAYAQQANGYFGKWDTNTKLNWDAFLERLTEIAKTQHDLPWNQKRYTKQVKRLLSQCNFPEFENIKTIFDNYEDKRENWFESETLHHEIDFQVSLFQFEKGEYIPHHDHPNMTGVLNVVSGNLFAKNYNIEEQLDSTREVVNGEKRFTMKKCVIREVENEILKAGDIGILTAEEGNIHSIMPNEFTQMVDVFTPAYHKNTNANWYNVNEQGFYNGQKNRYEAEYAINI
jgi:cysteamine dioxygenase